MVVSFPGGPFFSSSLAYNNRPGRLLILCKTDEPGQGDGGTGWGDGASRQKILQHVVPQRRDMVLSKVSMRRSRCSARSAGRMSSQAVVGAGECSHCIAGAAGRDKE
jgi:hypothetical protein